MKRSALVVRGVSLARRTSRVRNASHASLARSRLLVRSAPLLVVVLALLLSGCLGSTGGFGDISVTSDPAGARIFLDGEDTGLTTPAVLEQVRTGRHDVTVELDGYVPQSQSVVVSRSQTAAMSFNLDEAVVPIDPSHARVSGYVSENVGGRRLPGAMVTAFEAGTHIAVASAFTDDQGFYMLYMPEGTYDIVSDKAGHAQAKRQSLTLDTAERTTVHLIAKKLDDPAKSAVAPTIHVLVEGLDDQGQPVRAPFEAGTVVSQGLSMVVTAVVEAEHDVYRTQIWIGHRDLSTDWQGGLLTTETTFVLWDLFDAPGDTELVVAAYDWQNNWTEVRIPFTYEVSEPAASLHPVDVVDLTAFTYGHDLSLYRARQADIYEQLGISGDPDLYELSDGTVIDLTRLDKDVTMYVVVRWSEVDGAVGYEIERAFHRDGPWERIARVGDFFAQPYFDFGPELAPGKTVYYRVRGVGPNDEKGGWSSPTWVIPLDRFEISLTEPADDATNVSLTPTFRWTHTDVGADEYTFDIFVSGVTGVPGGESDYYAWYHEGLVNQTEALYNFDGAGEALLPGKSYQWNVVEGAAYSFYRLNSMAVAFAWTGPAEDNGYSGAANGDFVFTTTIGD